MPSEGCFDELLTPDRRMRAQWHSMNAQLQALGSDGFRRRVEQARRIVQENGITFNAFGEGESSHRPWIMDPLPMLVSSDEWMAIEQGIGQRVRLLNSVLSDLYGSQRLLRAGHIPSRLIHGNPHFLRPCHGFTPPNGVFIHLYAADLARVEDGSWRVLSDRIEVPSGIGYALENRFITQQVLPDLFRAAGPVRLRPFFQRMLESFETLVQRRTENPCIVMLSPGPGFETYFEQAFFARNLGYSLVEGADLTTRDNRVYMKTVAGLKQVDVIIRNVPSHECDPLELDPLSSLGVPGLVQAARAGNVVVANSLGTGVVESPAMPALLDGLCSHLLGEPLQISSAKTWWCGKAEDFSYVLDNVASLVVKPVFRRNSGEAVFGHTLDRQGIERLRNRINADPQAYCAQEMVSRSTLPTMTADGSVQPRRFLMRVFLVANGEGGYEMMPGALTRVSRDMDSHKVSLSDGGMSKDTWMIAPPDMPLRDHPLPHTGPVRIRRSTAELTSRDADNLFWMGRYMERIEYLGRLLRVLLGELRDSSGPSIPHAVIPFLNTALGISAGDADTVLRMDISAAEARLEPLVWEKGAPGGVCSSILCLNGTASSVKERLSLDAVSILNQLARMANSPRHESGSGDSFTRMNDIGILLAGVAGTMAENMTRAIDWRFLDLGRRIERALNVCELMLHVFSMGEHTDALSNLLVCADSRYTYASRYLTNMQAEAVVDLLLGDDTNPRSIAFQTRAIAEHVQQLPLSAIEEPQTRRRRLALGIASRIELADVRDLLQADALGRPTELNKLLVDTTDQLLALSDQLAMHYFSHSDKKKSRSSRSY